MNLCQISAAWLLVISLGSSDYQTRHKAYNMLKVMPWTEPVLLANMETNLELKLRAKSLIAYWHELPPGPLPGYYYVMLDLQCYYGQIKNRAKGDYVEFWWGDGMGGSLKKINWKITRFYESLEALAYFEKGTN